MSVINTHPEYDEYIHDWEMCDDASNGEREIKEKGEVYLPKLNGHTVDDYKKYLMRAVFFNATGRTVDGLTGLLFRKQPMVKIPAAMKPYQDDITLSGISLLEFCEETIDEVVTKGRAGILVDFPPSPGAQPTLSDQGKLNLRPYLRLYEAEDITNWKTSSINNKQVVIEVRLRENVTEPGEDEFSTNDVLQYRVLDLADGSYRQRVYRQNDKKEWVQYGPEIVPLKNGVSLDYIPFHFLGVKDSSPCVEKPILSDLVNINMAHYRNSADYENGLHWTGVPTPVISGNMLNDDDPIVLGSTSGLQLTQGSTATYLEFTGQGLEALRQAMKDKEDQMAVLGARILASEKRMVESAETAAIHRAGENSVLASIAHVAGNALTDCLQWAADWQGIGGEIEITLNTDYMPTPIDGRELVALLSATQAGKISDREFFEALQKGEVIPETKTFEEHQQEIDDQGPDMTFDPFKVGANEPPSPNVGNPPQVPTSGNDQGGK